MKFLKVILSVLGTDGIIKYLVEHAKKDRIFQKGKCTIKRCRNKGAMYSIGSKKPEEIKYLSFGVCSFATVQWMLHCLFGKDKRKQWGYSLLLGGSISNVLDRFVRHYVVDYIHIDCKILRKIIFNISDVCIVIGGFLVAIAEIFPKKSKIEK